MKKNIKVTIMILLLCFMNISIVKAEPSLVKTVYSTMENIVADIILDPSSNKNADRTNDIKNALNTCKNNRGGTVFLKAGVYRVSSSITIPRNCTLRGDYQDPDTGSGTINYGTIIVADVKNTSYDNVAEKTGLIKLSSGSGVIGLTFYYENQRYTLSEYTDTPWTIYYGHGELDGKGVFYDLNTGILYNPTYRASIYTIKDITLLNAFRGVGTSTEDQAPVESIEIENVRGTALFKGVVLHNSSESGTITTLRLTPDYWANMNAKAIGTDDVIPSKNDVISFMKAASATGLTLTDAEMYQMSNITIDNYTYCVFVPGKWDIQNYGVYRRAMGSGVIFNMQLTNCMDGIHASDSYFVHNLMGWQITHSSISGSNYSIFNDGDPNPFNANVNSVIKLDDVELKGKVGGKAPILFYSPQTKSYQQLPSGTTSMPNGLNESKLLETLYTNRNTKSIGTAFDYMKASSNNDDKTIQTKLNSLGEKGGGVLYLQPGVYEIYNQIIVPENVELRGAQGAISRQAGKPDGSGYIGTVLNIHPANIGTKYASAIELNGDNAGVSGIVFTYKDNVESMQGTNPTFTVSAPTVAAHNRKGNYVTNVSIVGAVFGIAFDGCSYFTVNNVTSTAFNIAIYVKNSTYGLIKNTLGNATVLSLNVLYNFPENYFMNIINYTHEHLQYIQLEDSQFIDGLNNFVYGANNFMAVSNSSGYFVNNGNDSYANISNTKNLSMFNFFVPLDSKSNTKSNFTIVNAHRFNGNTGTLYHTTESGNTVNILNSIPLRLNASNNDAKFENDIRNTSNMQKPQTRSNILNYNPQAVIANTNLSYNDENDLIVSTKENIYYSETKLTKDNYSTSGSTTVPKNINLNAGEAVIYYYIPKTTSYYERMGSVKVAINRKDISLASISMPQVNNLSEKSIPLIIDGSKALVKDIDYHVSYETDQNTDMPIAIIEGIGNYEGTIKKSYLVTRSIDKIEVTKNPLKTKYIKDQEDLDLTGGELTVTYSDGKTSSLSLTNKNISVSDFDKTTTGTKKITLTYLENKTVFDVNVIDKQVESIEVVTEPIKKIYLQNIDSLDLTGGVLRVHFTDNDYIDMSLTNNLVTSKGFDNKNVGPCELTISYLGKNTNLKVEIVSKIIAAIEVTKNPIQMDYNPDSSYADLTGGEITVTYSDGVVSLLSMSSVLVNGTFMGETSDNNGIVKIEYAGFNTDLKVNIVPVSKEEIQERKCHIIDGKYYNQEGNEVTKDDYNSVCQSQEHTSYIIPILVGILILILLFLLILIVYSRKLKNK